MIVDAARRPAANHRPGRPPARPVAFRTRRAALIALVALTTAASCVRYTGGARALDPARLTAEPGWLVVEATPRLAQQRADDCGAAALAMVFSRWRVPLSVAAAVAALPAPGPQGARLGDLRALARARGLVAFALAGDRATLIHEVTRGRPSVIGLRLRYGARRVLHHYEVVIAIHPERGQVATLDPARGWRVRSWAALEDEWRPAGWPMLIVLGPGPVTDGAVRP